MFLSKVFRRGLSFGTVFNLLLLCLVASGGGFCPGKAVAQAKKPAAAKRPMTQADVQKLWKLADDTLLTNEIRLRGLAFAPSGYWLDVVLPTLTSVPPSRVPGGAAALHHLIPSPPDLDEVATQAPILLNSLKAAAQKRSEGEMQPLIDPALMANKAIVYDLFDTSSFRASSIGKPAQDEHGDVGLPYFELTTSNVEKLYYVLFAKPKGKIEVLDIITGPGVADLYLHDQQALATAKLETMFRALDDGDQTGVKELCTPGLYQAIQDWGGDKHPGDRLSRGHRFSQVTASTSVPLDQKSIRVVTKVSYPLTASSTLTFFIDFERIGNELKVVRLRDSDNKVIVYDPNIDNYLNQRYGLPDGPPPDDVAMTDQAPFLTSAVLHSKAIRALQYHDKQQISDLARLFVESSPTSGDGYGIRAAVDLMKRDIESADKDGHRALELNGTAYFVLERHLLTSGKPLTIAILGISKSKIDYIPAPGSGSGPEVIDLQSAQVSFEKQLPFRPARPFLKLDFKGVDGKKKTYNLADFGTVCPGDNSAPLANDLVSVPSGTVCGVTSTSTTGGLGGLQGAQGVPVLTPPMWREDLSVVMNVINTAKAGGHN